MTKQSGVEFLIGTADGEHLRVEILGRENPNATDRDDGNWLRAMVHIASGPWKGSYSANLRSEEFVPLRIQLQRLYDDVTANLARFESMEPWLRFTVERSDRLGHVLVKGEARREPFFEQHNLLQFTLELDQSYLPVAVEGLAAVIEAFPVVG
ncbi:MAG: hypothetical protein ABI352_07825 [Candidatus Dormibacter sp.]